MKISRNMLLYLVFLALSCLGIPIIQSTRYLIKDATDSFMMIILYLIAMCLYILGAYLLMAHVDKWLGEEVNKFPINILIIITLTTPMLFTLHSIFTVTDYTLTKLVDHERKEKLAYLVEQDALFAAKESGEKHKRTLSINELNRLESKFDDSTTQSIVAYNKKQQKFIHAYAAKLDTLKHLQTKISDGYTPEELDTLKHLFASLDEMEFHFKTYSKSIVKDFPIIKNDKVIVQMQKDAVSLKEDILFDVIKYEKTPSTYSTSKK